MNQYVHTTVFFLLVCIDLVVHTCVYDAVCVHVCHTGVLSLYLHTSPLT